MHQLSGFTNIKPFTEYFPINVGDVSFRYRKVARGPGEESDAIYHLGKEIWSTCLFIWASLFDIRPLSISHLLLNDDFETSCFYTTEPTCLSTFLKVTNHFSCYSLLLKKIKHIVNTGFQPLTLLPYFMKTRSYWLIPTGIHLWTPAIFSPPVTFI